MDLFFDNEFRALIPALTSEEHQGLEDSLKREGNREPIVIWKETKLVLDGHHRYDICTSHGIPLKPATELSLPDRDAAKVWIIRNQFDRRNLSPYSRTVLQLRLEELLRLKAREAQAVHAGTAPGRAGTLPPTLAEVKAQDHEVREQIAKAAHVSHGTVDKVKTIERAASPEQKAKLVGGTATVNQVYVQLRREEAKERVKAQEWPIGKYRVLYADPPWQYDNKISADKFNDSQLHYPTMTIETICALPVRDLALDNAVLFLWVTSPLLEDSFKVINAWGFHYKTSFVWDKVVKTFGHYNGVRHEFLLAAVRGSCQPDISLQPDSVVTIAKSDHSHKPEEFRAIIESLYPYGPRIELFARKHVEGWTSWGNEV